MVGSSPATRYFILAFYFLFICFLFFLPGEAFPPAPTWFGAEYLDKLVHFGIFSILIFLLCWTWNVTVQRLLLLIFFGAVAYGLLVEVIQHELVANRTFSLGDWAADILGSVAGSLFWRRRYIKK